jgi:hypothetical protein
LHIRGVEVGFEVVDAVLRESGHALLADAVDVQAAVFGEHVDGKVMQPVLVFAEQRDDMADGEYD